MSSNNNRLVLVNLRNHSLAPRNNFIEEHKLVHCSYLCWKCSLQVWEYFILRCIKHFSVFLFFVAKELFESSLNNTKGLGTETLQNFEESL